MSEKQNYIERGVLPTCIVLIGLIFVYLSFHTVHYPLILVLGVIVLFHGFSGYLFGHEDNFWVAYSKSLAFWFVISPIAYCVYYFILGGV